MILLKCLNVSKIPLRIRLKDRTRAGTGDAASDSDAFYRSANSPVQICANLQLHYSIWQPRLSFLDGIYARSAHIAEPGL